MILMKMSFHSPSEKWLEMEVKLLEKQSHYLHTSCPEINTCHKTVFGMKRRLACLGRICWKENEKLGWVSKVRPEYSGL